jgi:hypothetical protein
MTVWFLIVVSCVSYGDPATCHNAGPPIMTFASGHECRAVVVESMRMAAQARKTVAYACEKGLAM